MSLLRSGPRLAPGGIASLVVVLVSACSQSLSDCPDAGCRVQRVEAAFRDEPLATLQTVGALPDPLEQAALVEALVYAFPNQAGAICRVAPAGSLAATRCQQLALRPHLYADPVLASAPRLSRVAPGPGQSLPPPTDRPAPWAAAAVDAAALRGDCGERPTCLADAALRRASAGEAAAAGQLCLLAWPEGSVVRDECVFQVAERLVLTWGSGRAAEGLAVCAGAGALAEHCTQHIVLIALPAAPPADRADRPSLDAMLAYVGQLEAAASPALSASFVDLAWSAWTHAAVSLSATANGRLMAAVPPAAAPHVRMAEAWRYAMLHPDAAGGLQHGPAALQASLGAGGALLEAPVPRPPSRTNAPQARALWRFDRDAGEAALPAAHALGAGRRLVSADPLVDLQIALLEAYGRQPKPDMGPLLSGIIGSEAPFELRWTAARLAADLEPQSAEALIGKDPDPRVDEAIRMGLVRPTYAK